MRVRLPGRSSLPLVPLVDPRSERYDQIAPATPNGTLTQNTARQCHLDSTPPMTSPRNELAIAAIWLMPSAVPRWCTGRRR